MTLDGLAALVGLLRDDMRSEARVLEQRLDHLQGVYDTLSTEVTILRQRDATLEQQVAKATDTALGAMRKAEVSAHEIETVGDSIARHIRDLEVVRLAEVDALKSQVDQVAKSVASNETRRRLDAEHVTNTLAKHAVAINALGTNGVTIKRTQLWLVTAVLGTVVALAQVGAQVTEVWIQHRPPGTQSDR